jgi:hypothetical protein
MIDIRWNTSGIVAGIDEVAFSQMKERPWSTPLWSMNEPGHCHRKIERRKRWPDRDSRRKR